eukprot:scaffold160441_cov32-Tisochrysis_lutea.AAC.1
MPGKDAHSSMLHPAHHHYYQQMHGKSRTTWSPVSDRCHGQRPSTPLHNIGSGNKLRAWVVVLRLALSACHYKTLSYTTLSRAQDMLSTLRDSGRNTNSSSKTTSPSRR